MGVKRIYVGVAASRIQGLSALTNSCGEPDYQGIVADPELLGGKLAIRSTRLAVSLILECLAGGMSLDDIDQSFGGEFPREALPEVLSVASEFTDFFHVAA
jgi:uncharacterized protein (DUF433 family)